MTRDLRYFVLLGILSISGSLSWGSNTACPTSASAYSSIQAAGCEAVDLNFTNFTGITGSTTGSPAPVTPTAGNTDVAASGSSVLAPIAIQFTGPTSGSPCGDGNTLWCVDTGGSLAACPPPNQSKQCYNGSSVGLAPSFTASVDPTQTSAPAGEYYAITSITLAVTNPVMTGGWVASGNEGSGINVFAYICLGGPFIGNCATPDEAIEYQIYNAGPSNGGIQTTEYTCFEFACSSGVAGLTLPIPAGVTQVGVELVTTAGWVSSGVVSLDAFSLAFNQSLETPEPSTLFLVGIFLMLMLPICRRAPACRR